MTLGYRPWPGSGWCCGPWLQAREEGEPQSVPWQEQTRKPGTILSVKFQLVERLKLDKISEVTITEASEDDYEYEEIPDDNFSIPEGEEDLAKAIHMVQEQAIDTQILEQKTVLPSKQTVPEVIEDFLCNFLIKMGMTRTLDCFQYELIQKGVTELRETGNVPDVYTQNMLLENENKNLKKDLKHYKQAADKAREDLLKTQKERDFHRMHHKRIVQEKNKLINDLKGLKLHYASYEPTMRVLHEKHHTLLKQKMLTSLERDRAVRQIYGLQATLKHMETEHSVYTPEIRGNYEFRVNSRKSEMFDEVKNCRILFQSLTEEIGVI
ncbi:hypothetical protein HPG69_017989 [Diceros bicornis minor]|uniref:Sperm-associated antigen 16 protein n=1 Tax=Diceros bicornis minor TaxID=77932 RepID=A0A7J7F3J3_DICBM|nr:hypothetical protein HPG69_017989 [Diceros bicornis minor]